MPSDAHLPEEEEHDALTGVLDQPARAGEQRQGQTRPSDAVSPADLNPAMGARGIRIKIATKKYWHQ